MEINDKYEVLKRLKHLLDTGVLTPDEFNKEKAKVLGDSTSSSLTEEQRVQLKKIEALKEAGILTEKEFEEQKRAILSPKPESPADSTSQDSKQAYAADYSSSAPKKTNLTLWIILGVVASIVLIAIIAGSNYGEYSNGPNGLLSNPYSEIDEYIDSYSDRFYREGNTVYYRPYQDYFPEDELIGSIIQNPDALSPFGDVITDVGKIVSGSLREQVLTSLINEDYSMIRFIAECGLNLCYKFAEKDIFFYTPEELKMKMSNP